MITIIYSTHKDSEYNNKFKQHLLQTVGLNDVQILEYQNNNEFSLPQVYNKGISESIYDIIVCCHNDIKLEKNWGKKLLKDFNENPEFGILGKAGSCYFPESGVYWEKMHETMVGHVYHHPEGKSKWVNKYSAKLPKPIPVVTLDGLFLSFDKNKIKHKFDETIGKFHFYDHPFCLSNFLDGIKLGVTFSFDITHQSVGMPNQEFFDSKVQFLEKYGKSLPLIIYPEIYTPTVQRAPMKIGGKVAVIIPHKNNFSLLKKCIISYFNKCDSNIFDIFIADTGSSFLEKEAIRNFISDFSNIKFIEYDYYHFAKINNDVVKNHLSSEHIYILFSNNDVELLNDVVYGMLKIHRTNHAVGTVGCRLHFKNGIVQHDGVMIFINKNNNIQLSHSGLQSHYNFQPQMKKVPITTAALMMVNRKVFEKLGYFSESYIECLEDVEFNLRCLMNGYTNYVDGNLVSYHYESQTRNFNPLKNQMIVDDFNNKLIPFISNNINKLQKYILSI